MTALIERPLGAQPVDGRGRQTWELASSQVSGCGMLALGSVRADRAAGQTVGAPGDGPGRIVVTPDVSQSAQHGGRGLDGA